MTGWRLVSDVGGTNVRFARAQNGGALLEHRGYPVSAHKDYLSAVHAYLDETGGLAGCTGAAIGAAGAIDNGKVSLTNAAWGIAEAEVASAIGAPCTLINDLQAVAFSLPVLDEADVEVLGDLAPNLTAARRVLTANIGTGFGAATLIRTADGWTSCPSEAGHMSSPSRKGATGPCTANSHLSSASFPGRGSAIYTPPLRTNPAPSSGRGHRPGQDKPP